MEVRLYRRQQMTSEEYGKQLGVSKSSARKLLESMVKSGKLKKVIKTHQVYWGNSLRTVRQSDYTEVVK